MISVFGGVLWSELLYRSVSTGAYGQALLHGAIFGLINRFTWQLFYRFDSRCFLDPKQVDLTCCSPRYTK